MKFLAIATLAMGSLAFTSNANAGDCSPRYYKTVVVYKTVVTPEVHYVIKYDSCGHPYKVKIVTYKHVKVPVTKKVLVCH